MDEDADGMVVNDDDDDDEDEFRCGVCGIGEEDEEGKEVTMEVDPGRRERHER